MTTPTTEEQLAEILVSNLEQGHNEIEGIRWLVAWCDKEKHCLEIEYHFYQKEWFVGVADDLKDCCGCLNSRVFCTAPSLAHALAAAVKAMEKGETT